MVITNRACETLPVWAPKELAEEYRVRVRDLVWQDELEKEHPGTITTLGAARIYLQLLKPLLSDNRMRPVWPALQCQTRWRSEFFKELVGVVFMAYVNFPHMPLRSRAQHRDFYLDIARRATSLLARLAESPYDFPSDLFVRVSPH